MPDSVRTPDATTTKFRIVINGTMDDVWKEITRTDAPIAAFFNNRMHVSGFHPGARLAMRTGDGKYTGVVGEILEYDPPRRFAHTFKFTNYDDPACRVQYDLAEVDGGVEFTLTVGDMPLGTKTAKSMMRGGPFIVKTLKQVIETGRPSAATRSIFAMFKLLAPISPKRCRSEHWPIEAPQESRE